MLGEVIRNKSFWLLDSIKHGHVKKELDNINNDMSGNYAIVHLDRMSEILKYAANHVPYYKNMDGFSDLSDFPVVNKKIIKSSYEEFQSDEYTNEKVFTLRTSGSTGQPFVIRQDCAKRDRCYAEMMYFWGLPGYSIGKKYVYYRTWNSKNKKSRISAFARNIIMRDVVKFDSESLKKEEQFLKVNKDIKMLLGYASTLENIGMYLKEQGASKDMFGVECVIAISEALSDKGKESLESVFGCPVVSHYSNSENGVLAQWDDKEGGFLVNTASFNVELLNFDDDTPVGYGERGRVVITDYFNHAMPFLRYDTGDIAVADVSADGHMILKTIEGRQIDFIYSVKGEMISPHELSVLFWNFPEVTQYKFIQTKKSSYVLKLLNTQVNQEELKRSLKGLLGDEADIKIEIVDNIPLAKSGKSKYIENLYLNN